MWNDEQETMLDAIHEGANCILSYVGKRPLEIPCIYDALKDERPILENGGGKKILTTTTVVVPLADENYDEYAGLTFKVGDRVNIKIRAATHTLRVDAKVLDEVSFNLSLISIEN